MPGGRAAWKTSTPSSVSQDWPDILITMPSRNLKQRSQLIVFLTCLLPFSVVAQSPSINFQSSRAHIFTTGDDGLQAFAVTIANPTTESIRNVSFSISMPAGLVLGSVDQECDESAFGDTKTLACTIQQVDGQNIHVTDFFVDGPLSTAPNGVVTMQISSSDVTIIEPSAEEASLADGDTSISGSTLTLQLVRDILFDGNNNTIPDTTELILLPTPDQSFEEILATDAIMDVMFLVSSTAREYLDGQLDQRISQLLTGTNEVFRENQVNIKTRLVDVRDIDYSESVLLEETLGQMQEASNAAFEDLSLSVDNTGADLVVLLHGIPPTLDEFCGVSSSVGLGRQGDYQADYHRGRLLTVLDVGPNCLGIVDLATSFAVNMGIVASRDVAPDGGTFSYSSGYGVPDAFRTITTRVGNLDNFGTATDVNRFSNPAILCEGLPCGINSTDIANGADATLSLNQTRHVISAINDPVIPQTALPDEITPTFSNAIDIDVQHQAVEAGAFITAFAEYEITITNTHSETLHDLNVSAFHLNNGLLDTSARTYRYDPTQCAVSGESLTTKATAVENLEEKRGRLTCHVDSLNPGESTDFNYFLQIQESPPELAEGDNYYHEIIALNSVPQLESAHCMPVYTDLADADVGSSVCNLVNELLLSVDIDTGFVDLEALPSVTGNILTVPFIRTDTGALVSATFQIVNVAIGQQELVLLSFRELNATLIPTLQSNYTTSIGLLQIRGLQLDEAVFDVVSSLDSESNPPTFRNVGLTEVIETE